ncbi:MAG: ribbon-helix-helix domain-containing protein [Methylococcales bacterium]|nr:ribbon-helix-helix domain-containing protein [Methylococcales bacterium]
MNTLSIHLPDNLEQQLSVYCEQNHRSKSEAIRFALENFFSGTNQSKLEDAAMVRAIQEGENSETISRADLFKLFEPQSCE